MLELTSVRATLHSYNARSENRGADLVPACDLKLEVKTGNDVLACFGSQLLSSLYWNEGKPAAQGELIEAPTALPNLRNPKLQGALAIEFDVPGYTLTIDYGLPGSEIVLSMCSVNAVKVTPHEGGTVTVDLRVQKSGIEEHEAGLLSRMVKRNDLSITLEPPSADAQSELEAEGAEA